MSRGVDSPPPIQSSYAPSATYTTVIRPRGLAYPNYIGTQPDGLDPKILSRLALCFISSGLVRLHHVSVVIGLALIC